MNYYVNINYTKKKSEKSLQYVWKDNVKEKERCVLIAASKNFIATNITKSIVILQMRNN